MPKSLFILLLVPFLPWLNAKCQYLQCSAILPLVSSSFWNIIFISWDIYLISNRIGYITQWKNTYIPFWKISLYKRSNIFLSSLYSLEKWDEAGLFINRVNIAQITTAKTSSTEPWTMISLCLKKCILQVFWNLFWVFWICKKFAISCYSVWLFLYHFSRLTDWKKSVNIYGLWAC